MKGEDWGDRPPLKPKNVILFNMILYNSENCIRDQGQNVGGKEAAIPRAPSQWRSQPKHFGVKCLILGD